MAKDSSNTNRNIDIVYYVSLALNTGEKININNEIFKKYLYLYALKESRISNIITSDYIEQLDKNDLNFVKDCLKEYIELLLDEQYKKIKEIVNKYINKDNNIENLKKIAMSCGSDLSNVKNSILNNFFNIYAFNLEMSELNIIKELELNIDNINNDKNSFYSEVKRIKSKKTEEASRDIIFQRLNDKYGSELFSIKEQYLADNRLDINIKYKPNFSYQVQIECKRDDNGELYEGIQNQLIGKYFSSDVQHGIYLIFYFGDKKDKVKMLKKVYDSIPDGYENKIKVICIRPSHLNKDMI